MRTKKGILKNFIIFLFFIWIGAGVASPKMGLFTAAVMPEGEDTSRSLPFKIPAQINKDSALLFPNASYVKSFLYSGGEEIIVYQYHSFKTAEKDMNDFAAGTKERVKQEESNVFEKNNVVITHFKERELVGGFLMLDAYIVGILIKEDSQAREIIIRTGEKIASTYSEYLKNFATPENCVATFVKAIVDMDMDLIIDALYFEPTITGRSYKNMMMMYLSSVMLSRQKKETPPSFSAQDVKISNVEMISEIEAKVEIMQGAERLMLPQWFFPGMRTDSVWIPLRKDARKWEIDMGKVIVSQQQQQTNRAVCISNLKQIGLALKMYAGDHKGKYPDNLSEIVPKYIKNPEIFRCPDDKNIAAIKELTLDTEISYEYVSGQGEGVKDSGNVIILYDKFLDHHKDGRNVLFFEGNVRWMLEADFQKLFNNQ